MPFKPTVAPHSQFIGETHIKLTRGESEFVLDALVVEDMDVDILAGIPFLVLNDITIRPAKHEVILATSERVTYATKAYSQPTPGVRRANNIIRATSSTTVWPGECIELTLPDGYLPDETVAIKPYSTKKNKPLWLSPSVAQSVAGKNPSGKSHL